MIFFFSIFTALIVLNVLLLVFSTNSLNPQKSAKPAKLTREHLQTLQDKVFELGLKEAI